MPLTWYCSSCGAYWRLFSVAQEQREQEEQQGRWVTHEIALHDSQHAVRAPGPCEHCTATWVPRIG